MTKFLTADGLKKIKEELDNRRNVIRQQIATAIKEAKEQGDISENAEYSEAKNQQAENEARISELEFMLKEAKVVSYDKASQVVQMGSKVIARYNGNQMEFQIVGSNESDPANFKISNESPIGKGFLGKKKGEEVEIETPGGVVKYKIIDVK